MEDLLEYLKSRQEVYKELAFRDSKLCDYYLGKADGIKSVLTLLEKEQPFAYRMKIGG